ncbi:hypothetical protein [Myxosarcina sp. GI1]|uniref:hypothetical protein n=1 Tax=Myxosarcina sp. GI1 TaxID=1541065 RepID=UPI00055DD166|nr:hypothetical protein [Myxosarcina sp. GI1]
MKEIPNYLRREKQTRNLALDYALGISILGLIPISDLLTPKLLVALGLLLKMLWDLGAKWKFAGGQDILAIAGYIFGLLGALAMAFMAWLTLVAVGLYVPYVSSFKLAAALFTLTWIVGQSTNQFYASSQIRSVGR